MPHSLFQRVKKQLKGIYRQAIIVKRVYTDRLLVLATAARGFTRIELPSSSSLGALARIDEGFYTMLEKVGSLVARKYPLKDRPSAGGDKERDVHRLLKLFAVYHALKVLGVNPNNVKVEDECGEICGTIPNVCIEASGGLIVVDVKTDFGVRVHDEILALASKYQGAHVTM